MAQPVRPAPAVQPDQWARLAQPVQLDQLALRELKGPPALRVPLEPPERLDPRVPLVRWDQLELSLPHRH